MRRITVPLLALAVLATGLAAETPKSTGNLVRNPDLTEASSDPKRPARYTLAGGARWADAGRANEFAPKAIALDSSQPEGSLSQDVTGFDPKAHRWYRFSFRGLPEANFAVANDDLYMKVEFFAADRPLDGVSRKLHSLVEQDRRDLSVNGNGKRNGAAVWKTYALEFRLPFPEIDRLRLTAGFRNGAATAERDTVFYITEFALVPIPDPADRPKLADKPDAEPADLVPLGGRWYYRPEKSDATLPALFTAANADRLYYRDSRLTNPFAENMSAWLRKGYKDLAGKVVTEDRWVPDSLTVRFEAGRMVVRAKNLPNHPTARFPGGNPHYIQEHNATYYLPLEPKQNPNAVAMTANNANRALPMGPIGIAVNGVVFFNPFDAGMQDAHDMMDRCCGHPSPGNLYHYHKYPVCVKSPFADEGDDHSPLIGWAFDGFPIYGPYESKGVMAKDCAENPLNEFNLHHDEVRGWHYHVTPGKFPYVIGGFWGEVDRRNNRGPRGTQAGGPGRSPGPPAGGGVRVLPPRVADGLTLTDEQKRQLAELEAEAKEKLDKFLTPEQRKVLERRPE
jgi:hypothetical protein